MTEAANNNNTPPIHSPNCPFCTISKAFQPINPTSPISNLSNTTPSWNPDKLVPPAYVILSTEHVIAFLDIAPLTRGHVLVSPRRHRVKIGDLNADEMGEVGRVLPLIARSVIRAVLPDIPHDEADYNIIQNNGPGAAQVIPHVHFHVVPRPPLNYRPPASDDEQNSEKASSASHTATDAAAREQPKSRSGSDGPSSKYSAAKIPTGLQRSYIQFGRGARHELDENDAEKLVERMRRCIREEWLNTMETDSSGKNNLPSVYPDTKQEGRSRGPEKL